MRSVVSKNVGLWTPNCHLHRDFLVGLNWFLSHGFLFIFLDFSKNNIGKYPFLQLLSLGDDPNLISRKMARCSTGVLFRSVIFHNPQLKGSKLVLGAGL